MKTNYNSTTLARLAFLLALTVIPLVSFVMPAVAEPITLPKLAGDWQGTLFIDGGCGLGTKLLSFNLDSTGEGSVSASYHTPGCGDNVETGTIQITALGTDGNGTAELNFGGTLFGFDIQVSPNAQVFNMVDIIDPANYEEGSAIRQVAPTISQLAGAWQATLFIDGGCGVGTKVVSFRLNSTGEGAASASYHTPGCGDNEQTGTMRITSLNAGGIGTAQLDFSGTVFKFNIQVSPNAQTFNMVDVVDANNYDEGLAVRQGSASLTQLAGSWQATLLIDGGCGIGTKLVAFDLNSSGEGRAVGLYHTPECGDSDQAGTMTITSLNSDGSGTAQLNFGGSAVFNFVIQVSGNHQVFNMVDVTDSGNYDEGSAVLL